MKALVGVEVELVTVTFARTKPDGSLRVVQAKVKGGELEPHPASVGVISPISRSASRTGLTHSAYWTGIFSREKG